MNRLKSLIRTAGILSMALYLGACAHGKMDSVTQELDSGSIRKDQPLYVETIAADDAMFSGDKAGDAARVDGEKREIRASFNRRIVDALKKMGYDARVAGSPVKSGVVLSGAVTKIEHGSAAARMLVGFGSGSANMYTHFKVAERASGKTLGDFEVIATSGGRGGLMAAGSFMEAHLEDGAQKVADYVSGKR